MILYPLDASARAEISAQQCDQLEFARRAFAHDKTWLAELEARFAAQLEKMAQAARAVA